MPPEVYSYLYRLVTNINDAVGCIDKDMAELKAADRRNGADSGIPMEVTEKLNGLQTAVDSIRAEIQSLNRYISSVLSRVISHEDKVSKQIDSIYDALDSIYDALDELEKGGTN